MSATTTTSTSSSMSGYVKPLVGAGVAIALDKLVLMNPNMNSSLYFGASVGGALFLVGMFDTNVPNFLPDITAIGADGATLSKRVAEITAGAGAAYAINKFLLKNDNSPQLMMKKLAVVIASDFLGEYASDYFSSRALSYFA